MSFEWLREPRSVPVALLLGAFDPPTLAHLALVTGGARAIGGTGAFCMTSVLLDRPADELLPTARRVELLLELAGEHDLGVAAVQGGTYLDVARAAADAGVDASFVIGSDKLAQIAGARFYPDGVAGVEATFSEVRFLVVPRGEPVTRADVTPIEPLSEPLAGISASDVRRRVRAGEPVAGLVPPLVARALAGYTRASGAR